MSNWVMEFDRWAPSVVKIAYKVRGIRNSRERGRQGGRERGRERGRDWWTVCDWDRVCEIT